ncbi:hypothetical protein KR093_011103 [Drosophila rubida]|uniref:Leucine-rich repeat-containing protein 15 n=1 Tax=Drosophila rubida TaxID=30044 RepID=A0AAD4PPS4_9MUSC|nr:hypothetical protein KR093_011103 [Drosophila rubida]
MNKWYASGRMTHCLAIAFALALICWGQHVLAAVVEEEAAQACLIRATVYVTPRELRQPQDFGLPLDIHCSNVSSQLDATPSFDLTSQRVAGKLHVLLNGSQTPPLNISSYGLEYLDNCRQLQSVEIEQFVGDASLQLSCAGQPLKNLSALSLSHNELGTLSAHSFELLPQLQQLRIEQNSLRLLEPFANCEQLLKLSIRREHQLALRQSDIFDELSRLQRLELTQLKSVAAELLETLPGELQELLVQGTPIEPHQLSINNGSEHLISLGLVQCDLTAFKLLLDVEQVHLLHVNLSNNALRQLQLASVTLISLDLSGNQLTSLNSSWFAQLPRLQSLQLQSNRLHSISLQQLLQLAPRSLLHVDLSSNLLLRLLDTQQARWDQTRQLRMRIDSNPWSCQWLLNFSHARPELFRLFSYAKYISQINVNGLSCRPQLEEETPADSPAAAVNHTKQLDAHAHLNVSSHTVLYGNPVHQPHSQRSEALIIVFMLPLGIALLFLLLYMYLHCERLFHWSYYSNGMGCFGGSKSTRGQRFVDHIDIVRYPVANGSTCAELEPQQDGYETPLSNAASICNCGGHRQSTCSRTHHVTYEAMPTELPYQLYAEIKEQVDVPDENAEQTLGETPASTAPIYDHLSYEEEKPLEV